MSEVKTNYLLKEGKYSIRVRKPLREHLNAKASGNVYINDLIEKDLKQLKRKV